MKKIYFLLILSFLFVGAYAQTTNFSYSGSIVNYTIPTGVTFINITAIGAQGGNSTWFQGGKGARISGDFTVTPGQVLRILVGEQNLTGGGNAGGGGGGSGGGGPEHAASLGQGWNRTTSGRQRRRRRRRSRAR